MSFFFSSRRRHTRFDCDWSSDVCSSDLWSQVLSRGAVADLADAVETPAIHDAGVRHATAVGIAGAYRRETHVACHPHGRQALGRGPVAQLAVIIVSPAIGGARGRDPAGVLEARAHRGQ